MSTVAVLAAPCKSPDRVPAGGVSFPSRHRDNSPKKSDCLRGIWAVRQARGTVFVPCRGRRCSSAWCRRAWSDLHAGRMAYGVQHSPRRAFFGTFTAPAIVDDVAAWNLSAPSRFAALVRDIRRTFGMGDLEYGRVLELQLRGLLHVHALLLGWDFCDFERVRLLCIRHGFGPRFEVRPVRSADGLGRYIASAYLAKSHEDLGGAFRVVQYSRGFPRDRTEQDGWAEVFNVADPAYVVPAGMSMWDWAESQESAGRGSLGFDSRSAVGYVRGRHRVAGLWDDFG